MVPTPHNHHFRSPLRSLSLICSFMGPLAGVMCSDYYLVRKGKFNIGELYNPNGLYRYNRGWNWRAFVAFLYVADGHGA
jgi:nucleobase:cation symporter-1, NCS1 family